MQGLTLPLDFRTSSSMVSIDNSTYNIALEDGSRELYSSFRLIQANEITGGATLTEKCSFEGCISLSRNFESTKDDEDNFLVP